MNGKKKEREEECRTKKLEKEKKKVELRGRKEKLPLAVVVVVKVMVVKVLMVETMVSPHQQNLEISPVMMIAVLMKKLERKLLMLTSDVFLAADTSVIVALMNTCVMTMVMASGYSVMDVTSGFMSLCLGFIYGKPRLVLLGMLF